MCRQTIFDTYIEINCDPENATQILEKLSLGADESELCSLFSEISASNNGEEYLKLLMRAGIIE